MYRAGIVGLQRMNKQTDRWTHEQKDRQETSKQTDTQTNRPRDGQTNRQIDGQTNRQTEAYRQKPKITTIKYDLTDVVTNCLTFS